MKAIKITFFVFAYFYLNYAHSQCNTIETVTVCDMTVLDGNNDTVPDGIINLYDAYNALPAVTPISPADGTWFDPGFNFALDESTGDLYSWDLTDSSESLTDYQFQLIDTTSGCPDDVVIYLNFILGAFSGEAVPTINVNDVNVEICDLGVDPCGSGTFFDLYQLLLSVPSAHTNGTWSYSGSSPNFIAIQSNRYFIADIPYQPGIPLVDEETFELEYTVPGIAPCAPNDVTSVKVSVIRQVFAGAANRLNICETEIVAGDFDADINLRDDDYLVNEDIEGVWLFADDPTGQISGPGDSMINLRAIYDDLILATPRFGCATYDFTYMVESRSVVCPDNSSTLSFSLLEYVRPFSQTAAPPEYCVGDDSLTTINLYDLLTFTTENGVLFDYPNTGCNNWTLVSGPSNLGLESNSGTLCAVSNPNYTAQGTIDLSNITNADAGTYVFEYLVLPEYNCNSAQPEIIYNVPDGCSSNTGELNTCNSETAQVTIVINPRNYAGEDTAGIEFCETDITAPIDLISLLTTNGVDDPIYVGPDGTWFDLATGNAVADPFTVPVITDQQTFNFVYTTSTAQGCIDRANLSFTVYEQYQAGTDTSLDICTSDAAVNLFDLLEGNPDTNGAWSGPNGFTTTDNNATFDPASSDAGDYIYTIPDNGSCTGSQSTFTVNLFMSPNAGMDVQATVCRLDNQIDLISILDTNADSGGTFEDIDNTNALSGSIVDLTQLVAGTYNFQYEVQGNPVCASDTSIVTLSVVEVAMPSASNQAFCINDGATLADLQVSNAQDYNWYADNTSSVSLPLDTVLANGEDYFVAALDTNGCPSPRVSVTIELRPFGSDGCDDCINDGVSNNGDNINDELSLCDLPVTFPDYNIKIFNRYGTVVFNGNNATGLFEGKSNVSLTIGDDLPSGVYFYIFDPRDNTTEPFQGNFYLSR